MNATQRAATEIRRADARAKRSGGRPLKGKELRVTVGLRFEPTMLQELRTLTGMHTGELVERIHSILKLTAEYRQAKDRMRDEILDKIEALIIEPLDKSA